jgi:hypothetical protein
MSSRRADGPRGTVVYPNPDFTPATYTILNFPVEDVESAVDELDAVRRALRAVRRVQPGGARPSIAWFRDPGGNILAVLEES